MSASSIPFGRITRPLRFAGFVLGRGSSIEGCRSVICACCRLLHVWPQIVHTGLDRFYDNRVTGDVGSPVRTTAAALDRQTFRKRRSVLRWGLKIMRRVIDNIHGSHILGLRARAGALSDVLIRQGETLCGQCQLRYPSMRALRSWSPVLSPS